MFGLVEREFRFSGGCGGGVTLIRVSFPTGIDEFFCAISFYTPKIAQIPAGTDTTIK